MKNPDLKLYQIGSKDGERDWVAAETNIKAIRIATSVMGYGLCDIEGDDIKEIPRDSWKDLMLEDDYGDPLETFEAYISRMESADVVASTMR